MEIPEISISGEKIFEFFDFPITNSFFMALAIGFFLFLLFFFSFKKKKIVPDSIQNFVEWILETLLNYIDGITGERKKTLEIFPLAASLFIFIFSDNLLEVSPGLSVFHFLRSPSSDLNFTLGLAITSMILIHLYALRSLGFFSYFKKYLNLKNPVLFFVGILEGIGEIIRALSLALRLFGNLLAGEILLIITSFLFVYFLPLPFLFLEIFVGFIQALIFSSLIVIFYVVTSQKSEE
jgi:F-type H+-transporting ATPase subunit a